ncbi:hypothetical protein B0I37DRAFT_413584 [Chaetomium sp. MPI-CAGE-AT-0009]|nr:hypothetical protein B0I37DRAFT_413584 [Chaetomium sp. MPI-CAGE-AT-0009]
MTPDLSAPREEELPAKEEDKMTDNRSEPQDHDSGVPRPTKFRFKSKSSRSSRRREGEEDDDRRRRRHRHRSRSRSRSRGRGGGSDDGSKEQRRSSRHHDPDGDSHRHRHRHRHHHRRRKHRSKSPQQQQPQQDQEEHDPFQPAPLSPTTAFRESLFDAMADDEGAAYWESVYGQPIHIYQPPTTSTSGGTSTSTGLEHMTDDEYAAYVRQKMWEKTHAGLLEARARREAERAEAARKAEERARVDREMERCLRRGEERRRRRGWRQRWEAYLRRWAEWEARREGVEEGMIPWPVLEGEGEGGGGVRDAEGGVRVEEVRAFFVNGIGIGLEEEVGEKGFSARLKEERVRWHPDKVQQRLGGTVDEKVMRDVTAIFQVVDALWNDTRKKSG